MMTFIRKSFYLSLFLISTTVFSQGFNESLYNAMKYRNIGPYRGGRSAAVDGVADNKLLAYFGATGGGVWRTNNGARPGRTYQMVILEDLLVPVPLVRGIQM